MLLRFNVRKGRKSFVNYSTLSTMYNWENVPTCLLSVTHMDKLRNPIPSVYAYNFLLRLILIREFFNERKTQIKMELRWKAATQLM